MTPEEQPHDSVASNDAAITEPAETIAMGDEFERLKAEATEARNGELRAQAELENFRKRMRREAEEDRKYAEFGLVNDLLPVMDNVGRAITAGERTAGAESVVAGFRLVQQQLEKVFAQHNCRKIEALNEPFDPAVHQAILQQPSAEVTAGHVVLVAQDGYRLHDRVVRPAQVIVSTGKAG